MLQNIYISNKCCFTFYSSFYTKLFLMDQLFAQRHFLFNCGIWPFFFLFL